MLTPSTPRNFGIVKHPGSGSAATPSQAEDAASLEPPADTVHETKSNLFAKKDSSTAQGQLSKKGFIHIKWHGKCEADKVSVGTYDVTSGGGMFGMVFDNTFSKQTSKTATFVVLTYPTGAPPQTGHHHLPNLKAGSLASASRSSLGKLGGTHVGAGTDSVDSLHSHGPGGLPAGSNAARSEGAATPAAYHVGTLLKRRRKKGQGYARRFFSLDYTTCTLSYYHDRGSSALRGAIPLSLAAIAADERRREISIDSGAEVWHLRASSVKDFSEWARALERASRIARGLETSSPAEPSADAPSAAPTKPTPAGTYQEEDREWQQVEALVSRIVGTRDALRRLVKDIGAQTQAAQQPQQTTSAASAFSEDSDTTTTTPQPEKKPFWKRKTATSSANTAQPAAANSGDVQSDRPKGSGFDERSVYDHCSVLLGDLDSVVLGFSSLLSTSKRRRMSLPGPAAPRQSYESTSTEEFFDAEAGDGDKSQLMMIDQRSEDGVASDADVESIHDSSSGSSVAEEEVVGSDNLHPTKPKSLTPLPISELVDRRSTIAPATIPPPSLIALVRKNVGKDLSTISMPVSTNEPISILQRIAEQLEYANLLDTAAKQDQARDRLLSVTAFAVSQFSNSRAKERAIRKPFNPLLGETFEMVRSDKDVPGGFRLLVEKVCHRPVRLAIQADGAAWSFAQSPAPTQKFWGKSAELTTEGRVRVTLRLPDGSDERYSWNVATVFLRNVVMGEKYVEPVGTMHVANDSTGARASVEFRAKGMLGGRSEDVHVQAHDPDGGASGCGLVGTWTAGLKLTDAKGRPTGSEIWKPGSLVENAANTYGMTVFAAGLNEVTALEKGKLPPTDSRLRPDQRLAEQGKLDEAEEWKTRLEEAQRARRRVLEEKGEEHRPRWFVKAATAQDGEEVWRIKGGKDGYWEERARGGWSGVDDIFDA